MTTQRLLGAWVLALLLLATLTLPAAGAPATRARPAEALDKIEPLVLEELALNGQTDVFVWLAEKADLRPAARLQTKEEKGRFVFDALTTTAKRTQKPLRGVLDVQGIEYQAFYIANKILVRGGTHVQLLEIAARPDVEKITANHQYQLQEPFVDPNPPEHIAGIESNIAFINADDVWALGYDGSGTVMAGNDTGLDWDHPAIINKYRGWNGSSADHNYNWWDATGTYPAVPGDGHGHGTHTTGTMVGDDGGANQIGVAPGAKTIHCKNMTDGGSGSDATFTGCFQWDLAPWDLSGANPNPDLAPDAINNSWGYWGGNRPQFKDEIQALHAAGILVEVSAGNEGSGCASLRSPGDYWEVLTTGSVNHAAAFPGTMTGFSSRGPSDIDGNYFPDITAPGENIRSSVPGGGYQGGWSGTSMSGPHATALVGLMWSACPSLKGMVYPTIGMVTGTAVPVTSYVGSCGGDYVTGPNNDWGYGTIDALAAVQEALAQCGDAPPSVSIVDPTEGQEVSGTYRVLVSASDDGLVTLVELSIDGETYIDITTNWDGAYYFYDWDTTARSNGPHTLRARATDDADQSTESAILGVTVNNVEDFMHVGDLDGSVASSNKKFWWAGVDILIHDADENPISGATVAGTWSDGVSGSGSCTTDGSGWCSVLSPKANALQPSVTFAVDAVTHATLSYKPDGNHDPDGDSNGTTIVVYLEPQTNQPPVATFSYACSELTCDFDATDSNDPDGTIVSYAWDFGDGTGSGMTPSHTYSKAGIYTVVLTVTDNHGATDTDIQNVPVGVPPTSIYVFAIDMTGKVAGPNLSAIATVTIYDVSGNPVEGATVSGTWSDDYVGDASGVTGPDGKVSFTSGKVRQQSATFTFTVGDVVKAGYTYDPALNVEGSDSIDVP